MASLHVPLDRNGATSDAPAAMNDVLPKLPESTDSYDSLGRWMARVAAIGLVLWAAALALLQNTDLVAREVVEKALNIAGDICVYTNQNITIEEL